MRCSSGPTRSPARTRRDWSDHELAFVGDDHLEPQAGIRGEFLRGVAGDRHAARTVRRRRRPAVRDGDAEHVVGDRLGDVAVALLALAEGFLGLLALGDVLGDPEHVARPALLVEDGDLGRVQDPAAQVRRREGLLGNVDHLARLDHLPVDRPEERHLVGRRQDLVVLADQLFPGVAVQHARRRG